MPFQVLSEALNLPDAVVRLNEPRWVFAETINLGTATGLAVLRSTWLRDTDPMYAPVADLINRARVEVLIQVVAPDPEFIFGNHEGLVMLLHPAGDDLVPSPEERVFTDIWKSWGDPVPIPEIAAKLADLCSRVTH